jgi:ribosomal protein S27AE
MKKIIVVTFGLFVISFSAFAQKAKQNVTRHVTLYSYACSMHPNFVSNKPGKCPQCGMDMTLASKEQMKRKITITYTCPVDADVVSTQPGKCPKCGKNLNLSKKEQMKAEVVKLYTCSMHPDVTSDKPGKCPKCGMELTLKNK